MEVNRANRASLNPYDRFAHKIQLAEARSNLQTPIEKT